MCSGLPFSLLLYYTHFSRCPTGEGQTETTAEEVASFTPLLSSFCQRNARRLGRKRPSIHFPGESTATAKHGHAAPPSTPCGNKILVQLGASQRQRRQLSTALGQRRLLRSRHYTKSNGKTALPQPGLGQLRRRGSCCGRAVPPAGSIPCLHHGKQAKPSLGGKAGICFSMV